VASASDTEIEPANAPPFGVIVGVLTVVFFEPFVLIVAVVGDRLVRLDAVLAVTVVGVVDVVVSVLNG
jgi:hypothetical protein